MILHRNIHTSIKPCESRRFFKRYYHYFWYINFRSRWETLHTIMSCKPRSHGNTVHALSTMPAGTINLTRPTAIGEHRSTSTRKANVSKPRPIFYNIVREAQNIRLYRGRIQGVRNVILCFENNDHDISATLQHVYGNNSYRFFFFFT